MAGHLGHQYRARSSTGASRHHLDEETSTVAVLISELRRAALQDHTTENHLSKLTARAEESFASDIAARDTFRRLGGFEVLLDLLQSTPVAESDGQVEHGLLAVSLACNVLKLAITDHRGNLRYFANRLHGWNVLDHSAIRCSENVVRKTIAADQPSQLQQLGNSLIELATVSSNSSQSQLVIRHGSAMATLLNLVTSEHCKQSDGTLLDGLTQKIHDITQDSIASQVALWDSGALSTLLSHNLQHSVRTSSRDSLEQILQDIAYLGIPDLNDVHRLFAAARTSKILDLLY